MSEPAEPTTRQDPELWWSPTKGVLRKLAGDQAQAHADAAVHHYFGPDVTARPHPGPTRWRLLCTSENRDELEWRPNDTAAQPAVLFTAEEANRA